MQGRSIFYVLVHNFYSPLSYWIDHLLVMTLNHCTLACSVSGCYLLRVYSMACFWVGYLNNSPAHYDHPFGDSLLLAGQIYIF